MKSMMILIPAFLLTFAAASPSGGSDLRLSEPVRATVEELRTVLSSPEVLRSKNRLMQSPGTVLDSTYYDWQENGGLGYRVAMYDDWTTKIVTGWTIARLEDLSDRTMLAYVWEGSSWTHGLSFFGGARSVLGSVSFWGDGCLVACGDADLDGQGDRAYLVVERLCGIYVFPNYPTSPDTVGINARMAVNPDGTFIITGNSLEPFNGISSGVMWDKTDAISGFDGWEHFSNMAPEWMDDDMEPPTIHSGSNGKVGVVIPDYAGSVRLFESTDYGETFEVVEVAPADTADLPSGLDSTAARLGWINSDITYVGEEPHVVWSAGQGVRAMQDYFLLDFKATIFHWSPSTGVDTVVVAATQSADPSRDDYVPTPWNHLSVDWPSIGLAVDGRSLVVAYTALSTEDIDSTAIPPTGHLDIWMTSSSDNGETWAEPQNVTNPDGTVLGWDDRYPSVAKVNIDNAADPGKDVYMIYQSDDLAGTFVQGTEGALNMDYIKFLGVDLSAVGIGDGGGDGTGPGLPKSATLSQNYPNPFNPATTIDYQVAERSHVKVEIYDLRGHLIHTLVDGRKTPGQYSVQWDGSDAFGRSVPSGIYVYRMKTDEDVVSTKRMVVLK